MLLARRFEPPNPVVGTLGGVVTLRDQALLVELVRSSIRLVGSVRVLVHLQQFASWGASGDVDSDAWWLRDDEGISKIAIVGQPEWRLPILTVIAQPLRRIPIRYFETEAAARAWLQADAVPTHAMLRDHRTAG
jgi:SpoIIAA-like